MEQLAIVVQINDWRTEQCNAEQNCLVYCISNISFESNIKNREQKLSKSCFSVEKLHIMSIFVT